MEEDKSLKNILDDDFGKIILKIRKDKNLTQKELADLINVSDRTISKWENGQSVPDLICIKNICKALGISPSSLVLDKKTRKEKIGDISSKIKCFLSVKRIINFIILCILIILSIFYFNNRNNVTIYKLAISSDDIFMKNGYIINTKYKNIIAINDLKLNRDTNYDNITVNMYTIVNGDKVLIYKRNKLENIFIDDFSEYSPKMKKDISDSISKELIISIVVESDDVLEIYEGKLSIIEKYQNGIIDKDINYLPIEYNKESDNYINNGLINKGYLYDKDKDTYVMNQKDYIISINLGGEYIMISKNEELKCTYYYYGKFVDYIEYDEHKNKIVYVRLIIDNNERLCKTGNCKNNYKEIDDIQSIYSELKDIL